ncbi:E6 protein [Deltapapillomavirus 5]|uniref:Protein E6 n=1 Tax=Deltapapillomavirus 5 TaxID=1175853 RepID=A0A0S2KP94_9PAPI|nr:E6 protein [Deltapapillomavirus 5]
MSEKDFLQFCCLWCRNPLGHVDALHCSQNEIRPVLRDGEIFAACKTCLETVLWLERTLYPGILVSPGVVTRPDPWIATHTIRCMYCGSKLTADEKDRHRHFGESLVSFRGTVRGRCYLCSRNGARPSYQQSASE